MDFQALLAYSLAINSVIQTSPSYGDLATRGWEQLRPPSKKEGLPLTYSQHSLAGAAGIYAPKFVFCSRPQNLTDTILAAIILRYA